MGFSSPLYLILLGSTTLILIMAANTAFADFPRLAALHAGNSFLPRQLTFRGSRLVFSNGIIALGSVAAILVIILRCENKCPYSTICHWSLFIVYTFSIRHGCSLVAMRTLKGG